ncbi:hypothetical protein V8C86DRAFT_3121982 [Haematococcus lacustris]
MALAPGGVLQLQGQGRARARARARAHWGVLQLLLLLLALAKAPGGVLELQGRAKARGHWGVLLALALGCVLQTTPAGLAGWVEIHVEGEAASYRSGQSVRAIGQVTTQMAEIIKAYDNLNAGSAGDAEEDNGL